MDLVRMGILKRKLTERESAIITREVLAMNLKSSEARFQIAILKAMKITNGRIKMAKILVAQTTAKHDEAYTPKEAIYPLLPFLKKEWKIWECASGTGELVKHFREEGFEVIGGNNFFEDNFEADVIVTNPPYSLKEEFIERAYKIGKPFALLLPLTALEGIKRGALYSKYGIQLIIPNRRINFMIPSGKKSIWFQTAWFTHGLNLPKDLIFVELKKTNSSIPPTDESVGILEATL
jgi:hypothetical protein